MHPGSADYLQSYRPGGKNDPRGGPTFLSPFYGKHIMFIKLKARSTVSGSRLLSGLITLVTLVGMTGRSYAEPPRHPLDVELGQWIDQAYKGNRIPASKDLQMKILESRALRQMLDDAGHFGSSAGDIKLKPLTEPRWRRLGLALALDQPTELREWDAELRRQSTSSNLRRPSTATNILDGRPLRLAGMSMSKALDETAGPHRLGDDLFGIDMSNKLLQDERFRKVVQEACVEGLATGSAEQGFEESEGFDDDIPIANPKPAYYLPAIRLALAVSLLSDPDWYELGRLALDDAPFENPKLASVAAIRFSADGKFLDAVGWQDLFAKRLTTRRWDVKRLKAVAAAEISSFSTPINRLEEVQLARNPATLSNDYLAARSRHELVLRAGAQQSPRFESLPETGVYRDIRFTPQGDLLAAFQNDEKSEVVVKRLGGGGDSGDRELFEFPMTKEISGQSVPTAIQYKAHVFSIDQHPSQPVLAAGIVRWEAAVKRGRPSQRPSREEAEKNRRASGPVKLNDSPTALVELRNLSDGKLLISIPAIKYTTFFRTTMAYYSAYDLERPVAEDEYFCPVRFSPDGRTLLAGLSLVDVNASKVRARLARNDAIFDAAFAPDGSWLATVGHAMRLPEKGKTKATSVPKATHVLRFWNTTNGELLAEIHLGGEEVIISGNNDIAPSLTRSPDGNLIATTLGESEATIRLWDTKKILAGKPRAAGLDPAPEYPIRLADQFFDFAQDAEEALQKRDYAAAIEGFDKAIKNMESRGESFLHNPILFQVYEGRAIALGLLGKRAEADAEYVRLMSAPTTGFGTELKMSRKTQLSALERSIDRDPKNPKLFDLMRNVVRRFKKIETGSITDTGKKEYEELIDKRIAKVSESVPTIKEDEALAQAYSQRAFLHSMKRDFATAIKDIERAIELDSDNAEFAEEKRRLAIAQHMAATPSEPIPKNLRPRRESGLAGTTWRMGSRDRGRTWTFHEDGTLTDNTWPPYYKPRWARSGDELTVKHNHRRYDRATSKYVDEVKTIRLLIEGDVLRYSTYSSHLWADYWIREFETPPPGITFDRKAALDAYMLGILWSKAVMNKQFGGKEEDFVRVWGLVEDLAKKWKVQLPEVPKTQDSRTLAVRTAIRHLLGNIKPLTEQLTAEMEPSEAFYFGLAIKSRLIPIATSTRQKSLIRSIADSIKQAGTEGGLPAEIYSPLVDKLTPDATWEDIQPSQTQFLQDTFTFLKKEG